MIESAHAQISNTNEFCALSDLHRLEATLAMAEGKPGAAEQQLQKALEVAQEQGAKLWQLRAAIDFAQLKFDQQKFDDGRSVLQVAYDCIAEGDCEADRTRAKELLVSLSA